jgi:hypothetical protein
MIIDSGSMAAEDISGVDTDIASVDRVGKELRRGKP